MDGNFLALALAERDLGIAFELLGRPYDARIDLAYIDLRNLRRSHLPLVSQRESHVNPVY